MGMGVDGNHTRGGRVGMGVISVPAQEDSVGFCDFK